MMNLPIDSRRRRETGARELLIVIVVLGVKCGGVISAGVIIDAYRWEGVLPVLTCD